MTWPHDGPPCAPSDICARIEALVDPWARLRVRWIWLVQTVWSSRTWAERYRY